MWRILLYSSVLIALILISTKYFLPWILDITPSWGRLICSNVTLLAMAPFLLALATPASKRTERQRLRSVNAHFDVPLIVMTLFRLILTLGFIIYTLSSIHSMRVGWLIGFLIFFTLIGTFSRRFRKRLSNIESTFFNNLNERELRRSGKNNNLVSDLHLAFIEVGYSCPFVGDRLIDSNLRQRYGVNVASIQRGGTLIEVPNGNTRIFPGDVLGIIGTDPQIEALLPIVENNDEEMSETNSDDFKMTHIQLSESSPLIGQTSASSRLRDKYKILLVAIQHADGSYEHPTGQSVFAVDDVLWMVGNTKIIGQFK